MMLALSVRQPWAEALVRGGKTIEVRTWGVHCGNVGKVCAAETIGQLIAIHTGRQRDRDVLPAVSAAAGPPDRLRLGGVVGVATLAEVFRFTRARWQRDAGLHLNPLEWWDDRLWGWRFERPVRFERVIPCPGRLRLFELPPNVEEQVGRAMEGCKR
jgi:hypothetical protein